MATIISHCALLSAASKASLEDFLEASYAYRVEFQGIENEQILCLLNHESKLIAQSESPPSTAAGLQRRIDEEIALLLKVLQSQGYYHASIIPAVDDSVSPLLIALYVDTGPAYTFRSFLVVPDLDTEECFRACQCLSLQDLGVTLGSPAYPKTILRAEDELLSLIEKQGYPLAKLGKKEVIADVSNALLDVKIPLNCGPKAFFGQTCISGSETLLPVFFSRKVAWKSGELYDPGKVQRTLNALETSGLFSSIAVTHADAAAEDGTLPMRITVDEAKQRSIGFGVGYATDLGFGANGEWEHRNITGIGDKLSLVTNLWQVRQEGFARYTQPDFLRPRQDLIVTAEAEHEAVKAFREASFSFSAVIERQVTDTLRISGGAMATRLWNTHSNNDGMFTLLKIPLQMVWNRADKIMDPTSGWTLHVKAAPAYQAQAPCFAYSTQWLSGTAYQSLDANRRVVIAAKATLGSIWGATKHSIPPSERFYAGSDSLLRGYHYLTVCPLNALGKPIGGRSLMVYSLEARIRLRDPFGVVLFYDIGNVYGQSFPQFNHKQLQSAGIGLRYHTPVGPIRLDVAIPFNPRKHLDKGFQIYFSIGQSF